MLRFYHFFLFFILTVFLSIPAYAKEPTIPKIQKIQIEGNQRVETDTIRSYISLSEYEKASQQQINDSLKKLFSTGLFANVEIIPQGDVIRISVTENPTISQIAFEGNKRIKKEDLASEISLKERSLYTKDRLQNDTNRILDIYHKSGRFSATVTPKIITLPQNRVNVIFEIDEGPKTTVKKIFFSGNNHFSDQRLSSIIRTQESRWYRFFSSNDTYDADRVNFDKELLRKFYTSVGYADFKVISTIAELTPEHDGFLITYTLDEGPKYKFGTIDVESTLKKVQTDVAKKQLQTIEGDIFNEEQVETSIDNITRYLGDLGYAFVDIDPEYTRDLNNNLLNIRYMIREGRKMYINRINITGNVRTLDKVIRREFRFSEGDPYNAAQIKRSEQRIKNLGFFEKVELITSRTDASDKVDITVNIEERSTGEINFGAGYSTTDGALVNAGIRERNFLGKGQDLRFDITRAQKKTDGRISFTEPYFMDRDISAGFDLFSVSTDRETESSYKSQSNGFVLRSAYDLTEYLRHSLRYSFKSDDITDVSEDSSLYIQEQEGQNTTSLVGQTFLYDRRNSTIAPTKGYYLKLQEDVAGLGGDSKFLRHEVRSGYFIPVIRDDIVLQLSAGGGYIFGLDGSDIRINERFFLGGDDLRGFKTAGVGPRDSLTGDALGGNSYYVGSVELQFPLGLPDELDFSGVLFTDVGSLWDTDSSGSNILENNSPRVAVGAGIAWGSPVGPIRLDVGFPIMKEDFDRTQQIRFSFGTRF